MYSLCSYFLTSLCSVVGAVIFLILFVTSKAKANYGTRCARGVSKDDQDDQDGTRCARGVSKATAKAKKRFSEGRGSNVVRSLAGARSVNDCIV